MSTKDVKGINLKIGGDTAGLNKALDDSDKKLNSISKELKAVDRLLKLDPSNTELLAQKQKLLSEQVDLTSDKMKALKKSQEAADEAIKNGTEISENQYRALQREIIATEQSLKSLESEADGLGKIADKTEDITEAAKEMEGGFSVGKGAVAGFVADTASSFISAVGDMLEESREFRNEMAKLETSFQTAELSSEDAKQTFIELYGIMGDEGAATEASQQLAKISKNEDDLKANTRILTGVMAEYGDSIPTEGLAEGIAATSAMGEVQGVLADALEWQGINLDKYNEKLNELSSEEERATYIQKTLTDLYGESADMYRENNAAIIESQEAQARLNDIMAEISAVFEPIMTGIKNTTANLLESFAPIISLIGDGVSGLLNGTEGASEKLMTGVQELGQKLSEKIIEIIPSVLKMLGNIIPQIIAMIPALANSIITALVDALPSLIDGATMFFMSIIDAIPSVVEAISINMPEIISKICNGLTDAIPQLIDSAIKLLMSIVDAIPKIAETLTQNLPQIIEAIVSGIINAIPELILAAIELFGALIIAIPKTIIELKKALPRIIFAIAEGLLEGLGSIKEAGGNLLMGIWEGITDKVEWLKGMVGGVVNKIKSWFTGKDGFDTHSPSKWSEGVFANVMDGAAKGALKTDKVMAAVKASLGKVKNAFLTDMPGGTINVLSGTSGGQRGGNVVKHTQITQHYHGYKGTISENNAALKKTMRNMEVSLA